MWEEGTRIYGTPGVHNNFSNDKPWPYIFWINGQNHHKIGSLMPTPGQTAKFAQLYIYDTKNEVSNRMKAIFKQKDKTV